MEEARDYMWSKDKDGMCMRCWDQNDRQNGPTSESIEVGLDAVKRLHVTG